MKIKKRSLGTKKSLLYALVAVLLVSLLAIAGYTWFKATQSSPQKSQDDTTNYAPPTKEEVKAGQDAKKREERKESDTKQTPSPENSDAKKSANVLISSADIIGDELEIRAFVNNHVEKGTCTAIATKDSISVRKSTTAFTDVNSSICPPMRIPVSKLPSGTWTITVTYSSDKLTGTSEAIEKQIP